MVLLWWYPSGNYFGECEVEISKPKPFQFEVKKQYFDFRFPNFLETLLSYISERIKNIRKKVQKAYMKSKNPLYKSYS